MNRAKVSVVVKSKLEHIRKGRLLVVMYVLFFSFLAFTDPRKLPILFLILPVAWLWICLSLSFFLLINKLPSRRRTTARNNMIYSVILAGFVCLILLLRSVDQLNTKDVILVLILFLIARPYLRRLFTTQQAK